MAASQSVSLDNAIGAVESQIAVIYKAQEGLNAMRDYVAWRAARDTAFDRAAVHLAGLGATIRQDWRGAAISFAGIRATSTSELNGALHNWLTQARRKAGGA